MPSDYTLADLVKLTGVSARTVRYYIAQGLLASPSQSGPAARYSEAHLDRLRLIRRLQAAHLPLAEIRRRLEALPDDEIAAAADALPTYEAATDTALDYINTVLRRGPTSMPASLEPPVPAQARRAIPAPAAPAAAPAPLAAQPPREPDRAQWERITLDPDVELHVRRPLSRLQNKRVERLVSIARQLLEED